MNDYCPDCGYFYDEDGGCNCLSICPCGCNSNPKEPCVYDSPLERHEKNILAGKPDEAWVVESLKNALPVGSDWGCPDCGITWPYWRLSCPCGNRRPRVQL